MDVTIFLAKVLGIYLFIVSLALLIHPKKYRAVIKDVKESPSLLLVFGLLALISGSLIVVSHNIWEMDWRVLITLVGWLALLKGVLKLLLPQVDHKLLSKFISYKFCYHVCSFITLILGVIFCYQGFMA